MPSSLVHLIYTSAHVQPLSQAEVDALIEQSRESNRRNGITGILFYVGGCFMQVVEGEPRAIGELYAKLLRDPRHTRVTLIIQEAIQHRFFGDWTMAMAAVGSAELATILDAGDASQRDHLLGSLDEGRAKKLLRAFSEGRWRHALAAHSPSIHGRVTA